MTAVPGRTELVHSEDLIKDFDNVLDLEDRIFYWGQNRNITAKGMATGLSQLKKLREEIDEIEEGLREGNEEKVKDGLGDARVVLNQIHRLEGFSIDECLAAAWDDIKDRRGTMIAGVFVKEKDIQLLDEYEKAALVLFQTPDQVRDLIDKAKRRHTEQVTTIPPNAPRLP